MERYLESLLINIFFHLYSVYMSQEKLKQLNSLQELTQPLLSPDEQIETGSIPSTTILTYEPPRYVSPPQTNG